MTGKQGVLLKVKMRKVYQTIIYYYVIIIQTDFVRGFVCSRSSLQLCIKKNHNYLNSVSAQQHLNVQSSSGENETIDNRNSNHNKWNVQSFIPFRIKSLLMLSLLLHNTSPALADVSIVRTPTVDTTHIKSDVQLNFGMMMEQSNFACENRGIVGSNDKMHATWSSCFQMIALGDNNENAGVDLKSATEMAQNGGKYFFVIYVVFSLIAGVVEMTKRFQTWLVNREQ